MKKPLRPAPIRQGANKRHTTKKNDITKEYTTRYDTAKLHGESLRRAFSF